VRKYAKISSEDGARVQTESRYRLLFQIETLIAEFSAQRSDLLHQITAEEDRSKQTDPAHFAYSPLATSLRARVENLDRSIADLDSQLNRLKDQIPESFRIWPVEGKSNLETFASQMEPDEGRHSC
jgi:hypothetical protein